MGRSTNQLLLITPDQKNALETSFGPAMTGKGNTNLPYSKDTLVSAKHKGAYCEAQIIKVVQECVEVKVKYHDSSKGSSIVSREVVRGSLGVNENVLVCQEDGQTWGATVLRINDNSKYLVSFDDDEHHVVPGRSLRPRGEASFKNNNMNEFNPHDPMKFSKPVSPGHDRIFSDESKENSDQDENEAEEGKSEEETKETNGIIRPAPIPRRSRGRPRKTSAKKRISSGRKSYQSPERPSEDDGESVDMNKEEMDTQPRALDKPTPGPRRSSGRRRLANEEPILHDNEYEQGMLSMLYGLDSSALFMYDVGDKIQALSYYDGQVYRGQVIGRELRAGGRRNRNSINLYLTRNPPTPHYLVHYKGWSERYEEWIAEDQILGGRLQSLKGTVSAVNGPDRGDESTSSSENETGLFKDTQADGKTDTHVSPCLSIDSPHLSQINMIPSRTDLDNHDMVNKEPTVQQVRKKRRQVISDDDEYEEDHPASLSHTPHILTSPEIGNVNNGFDTEKSPVELMNREIKEQTSPPGEGAGKFKLKVGKVYTNDTNDTNDENVLNNPEQKTENDNGAGPQSVDIIGSTAASLGDNRQEGLPIKVTKYDEVEGKGDKRQRSERARLKREKKLKRKLKKEKKLLAEKEKQERKRLKELSEKAKQYEKNFECKNIYSSGSSTEEDGSLALSTNEYMDIYKISIDSNPVKHKHERNGVDNYLEGPHCKKVKKKDTDSTSSKICKGNSEIDKQIGEISYNSPSVSRGVHPPSYATDSPSEGVGPDAMPATNLYAVKSPMISEVPSVSQQDELQQPHYDTSSSVLQTSDAGGSVPPVTILPVQSYEKPVEYASMNSDGSRLTNQSMNVVEHADAPLTTNPEANSSSPTTIHDIIGENNTATNGEAEKVGETRHSNTSYHGNNESTLNVTGSELTAASGRVDMSLNNHHPPQITTCNNDPTMSIKEPQGQCSPSPSLRQHDTMLSDHASRVEDTRTPPLPSPLALSLITCSTLSPELHEVASTTGKELIDPPTMGSGSISCGVNDMNVELDKESTYSPPQPVLKRKKSKKSKVDKDNNATGIHSERAGSKPSETASLFFKAKRKPSPSPSPHQGDSLSSSTSTPPLQPSSISWVTGPKLYNQPYIMTDDKHALLRPGPHIQPRRQNNNNIPASVVAHVRTCAVQSTKVSVSNRLSKEKSRQSQDGRFTTSEDETTEEDQMTDDNDNHINTNTLPVPSCGLMVLKGLSPQLHHTVKGEVVGGVSQKKTQKTIRRRGKPSHSSSSGVGLLRTSDIKKESTPWSPRRPSSLGKYRKGSNRLPHKVDPGEDIVVVDPAMARNPTTTDYPQQELRQPQPGRLVQGEISMYENSPNISHGVATNSTNSPAIHVIDQDRAGQAGHHSPAPTATYLSTGDRPGPVYIEHYSPQCSDRSFYSPLHPSTNVNEVPQVVPPQRHAKAVNQRQRQCLASPSSTMSDHSPYVLPYTQPSSECYSGGLPRVPNPANEGISSHSKPMYYQHSSSHQQEIPDGGAAQYRMSHGSYPRDSYGQQFAACMFQDSIDRSPLATLAEHAAQAIPLATDDEVSLHSHTSPAYSSPGQQQPIQQPQHSNIQYPLPPHYRVNEYEAASCPDSRPLSYKQTYIPPPWPRPLAASSGAHMPNYEEPMTQAGMGKRTNHGYVYSQSYPAHAHTHAPSTPSFRSVGMEMEGQPVVCVTATNTTKTSRSPAYEDNHSFISTGGADSGMMMQAVPSSVYYTVVQQHNHWPSQPYSYQHQHQHQPPPNESFSHSSPSSSMYQKVFVRKLSDGEKEYYAMAPKNRFVQLEWTGDEGWKILREVLNPEVQLGGFFQSLHIPQMMYPPHPSPSSRRGSSPEYAHSNHMSSRADRADTYHPSADAPYSNYREGQGVGGAGGGGHSVEDDTTRYLDDQGRYYRAGEGPRSPYTHWSEPGRAMMRDQSQDMENRSVRSDLSSYTASVVGDGSRHMI
eukprot:Ihof_evm10s60 gene=Ihof_evmTU10s60